MAIADLLSDDDAGDFARDLLFNIGKSTLDFIYTKDLHSRMIFANRAVLEAFGKTWADIRGKTDLEWHSDPDEGRALMATDARIRAAGTSETAEEIVTNAAGPQMFLSTKCPFAPRMVGSLACSASA